MPPATYTRIIFQERPTGELTPRTFRVERVPFDLRPAAEEVLVKTLYLSLDPTQRMWLNPGRNYMEPVQVGDVMRGTGLGVVVDAGPGSRHKVGDIVDGMLGWREYGVHGHKTVRRVDVPQGCELIDEMGPIGMTGLTAYFGLFDVGKIKAGETLVVSGAAGATGSIACQLGKRAGAKVIAIAGSKEKCDWLETELGVDKAINYKSPTFREDFIKSVGYLDVFFDNVGGDILNLALARLNKGARVALCGAISDYNSKPKGLTTYLNLISQRARLEGFLVLDYASQFSKARQELSKMIQEGSLKRQFHVVEGIEKCPEALPLLFSGGNIGKLVVKVADHRPLAKL
ncbi:NADP-dependent oxidoreductase [Phanerochaete sordida]|uniref:NADP-dependent oxidoreductase n=1 Tax=Phanerochaete sordida TaxID=48140 RepID=A0A9P3G6F5_9APHY|nr:NADP-dependent oxidoreductase [Phanerochaete sordida]